MTPTHATIARRVGKSCYGYARALWGPDTGWRLLEKGQKYNAVCRQIVSVLMAQGEQNPDTLVYLQEVARAASLCLEEEALRGKR